MERINKDDADNYKHKCRKELKILKKENPSITKAELKKQQGDPVLSIYHPLKFFGSISETMEEKLKNYLENESD